MIDWTSVFDETQVAKGATGAEGAAFAKDFALPLSENEIAEIKADLLKAKIDVQLYDPAKWVLPNKPLPETFLNFLTWNNGGWCRKGEREFGFLGIPDLRSYTLAYMFPAFMPEAVPFALNGGGVFYVFDMREEPDGGEYPILISASGNLGYEDAKVVAQSFIEVCSGTTNIEDYL
ncbi:MAG TPA: SMI1/KNR4 family protein [Pyrinomonadaceae bacterium]|jgi:hypothetical protein